MNTPLDYHPDGCKIVIPIVLKITIYFEPEVVEMPPVCHPQVLNLESASHEERDTNSVGVDIKQNPNIPADTKVLSNVVDESGLASVSNALATITVIITMAFGWWIMCYQSMAFLG